MDMEWCNSYHYVSAIFIEPFQAGIKICTRIRTEESAGVNEAFSLRWFSLCLLLTTLHSVYCAVILALIDSSMNFCSWNFAFQVQWFIFCHWCFQSTGSWSKWLLVLGNLRASTLQVRSLNDHLLSSQKTCVFRGLLCVSENFVFRDGNLSSVMNWLNSCRLINNTARTGRFLLKWTNQVTGNTDLSYLKWYTHFVLSCLKGSPLSWRLCRSHNIELLHLTGAVYTEPALSKSLMTFSLEESLMVDRLA